jgi:hypothetical protein
MKRILFIACLLAVVIPVVGLAQKSTVSVLAHDKAADFSKMKTYEWVAGHEAIDPAWDKSITEAVDKALAAKGLKKGAPADLLVTYHAVQRTDVDLSTFDGKKPEPGAQRTAAQTVKVGTLAIDIRDANHKLLWRVASEGVITKAGEADRDATVAKRVAEMFEKYPKK